MVQWTCKKEKPACLTFPPLHPFDQQIINDFLLALCHAQHWALVSKTNYGPVLRELSFSWSFPSTLPILTLLQPAPPSPPPHLSLRGLPVLSAVLGWLGHMTRLPGQLALCRACRASCALQLIALSESLQRAGFYLPLVMHCLLNLLSHFIRHSYYHYPQITKGNKTPSQERTVTCLEWVLLIGDRCALANRLCPPVCAVSPGSRPCPLQQPEAHWMEGSALGSTQGHNRRGF